MEDRSIVDLYFARDERAIEETAGKYGKLCHSIAYRILNNREDAEECVSDTYVGAWNAIPPARPGNLMAFVCRITRNQSLKRLEFLKREKRSPEVLVSLEELAGILPDERFVSGMGEEDLGQLISRFLRGQKEEVRNVFIRKYYFFDSIEEIARRYAFTQSKVKNMLFQTRIKLKDYLKEEGVAL